MMMTKMMLSLSLSSKKVLVKLWMIVIVTTILIRQYSNYNRYVVTIQQQITLSSSSSSSSSLEESSILPSFVSTPTPAEMLLGGRTATTTKTRSLNNNTNTIESKEKKLNDTNNNVDYGRGSKEETPTSTTNSDKGSDNEVREQQQQDEEAGNTNVSVNTNKYGERWKVLVRKKLIEQELSRRRQIKKKNGSSSSSGSASTKSTMMKKKKQETIQQLKLNFKRLHQRLHQINVTKDIDTVSNWHTVTPTLYQTLQRQAKQQIKAIVSSSSYSTSDCILWLQPPSLTVLTAITVERDDLNHSILPKDKIRHAGPVIKFQCGSASDSSNRLQDEPCNMSGGNLCIVQTNLVLWNEYYHNDDNAKDSTPYEDEERSRYNYAQLYESILMTGERRRNNNNNKSVLLSLVDTIDYLKNNGHRYIWESFLNKASYALRTGHALYLWIGTFSDDADNINNINNDDNVNVNSTSSSNDRTDINNDNDNNTTINNNILHRREIETVSKSFGTRCAPEMEHTNTINYYKPIAFYALFQHLEQLPSSSLSSTSDNDDDDDDDDNIINDEHRIWFLDADMYFNEEAFPSIIADTVAAANINNTNSNSDNEALQSLDDYFDLSSTASLFGSQNPSGKNKNILLNGGLLGMRRRLSSSQQQHSSSSSIDDDDDDDWILDFAALWWYCRCGERDQIALWLLLFATWSYESCKNNKNNITATTATGTTFTPYTNTTTSIHTTTTTASSIFSYPSVIFESYWSAWYGVMPHVRSVLIPTFIRQQRLSSSSSFNGGMEFMKSSHGDRRFTYPLELPHVLILPLDPFDVSADHRQQHGVDGDVRERGGITTNFTIGIVKKDQSDKKALLSHFKDMYNTCYNFKCYPYLIRSEPIPPLPS